VITPCKDEARRNTGKGRKGRVSCDPTRLAKETSAGRGRISKIILAVVFQIPDQVCVFIYLRSCPAEHNGEQGVIEQQIA